MSSHYLLEVLQHIMSDYESALKSEICKVADKLGKDSVGGAPLFGNVLTSEITDNLNQFQRLFCSGKLYFNYSARFCIEMQTCK